MVCIGEIRKSAEDSGKVSKYLNWATCELIVVFIELGITQEEEV